MSTNKKKVIVLSVGRSDYDRYNPVLEELHKSKKVKPYLFLTRDHFNKKFGITSKFINKKFNIIKQKYNRYSFDDNKLGDFTDDLIFLKKILKKINPDFFIVLGDRYEMMLGPIACLPKKIPVVHFFGGAVTEGSSDELVRHAITKMSHLHLVALEKYKKRLIQMGEENWRIKNIGVVNLRNIKKVQLLSKKELTKKYNFNFSEPFALFTYHPTTHELSNLKKGLKSIFNAIKRSKLRLIITYPNSDIMYNKVIKFIKSHFKNKNNFKIIKNSGFENFINFAKNSEFIIGNSSTGIVDAATLKMPAINIGTRQNGKFIPKNVIQTDYNEKNIIKSINIATSKRFKKLVSKINNPYENRTTSKEIVNFILKNLNKKNILIKKFSELNK